MASKAEKLARKLFGTKFIRPVKNRNDKLTKRYKVVVFVPLNKTDELTFAMASAGAGMIGNYSLCSFRTPGVGTFMGNTDAKPAIGKMGKFEMAGEIRLEMICDKKNLNDVIDEIYRVHPYDEPAIEIYEVMSGVKKQNPDIADIVFKKKLPVKTILKLINPGIIAQNIPGKIKNTKIEKCRIDCSDSKVSQPEISEGNVLYIRKNKKNIKAYLI